MSLVLLVTLTLSGILLGSFLNLLIHRLPEELPIFKRFFYCPGCNSKLTIDDFTPWGKNIKDKECAICKARNSTNIWVIISTVAMLIVMCYRFGIGLKFFEYSILGSILICVFFIDLRHYIIPDRLNLTGLIFGLLFMIINKSYADSLLGLLVGGGIFTLIVVASLLILKQEGMGIGDVKLMGVLGLFFGVKDTVLIFILSFFIGAVISVFLLGTHLKTRKDYIPFGPFIVAASFVTLFFGQFMLNWYWNLH